MSELDRDSAKAVIGRRSGDISVRTGTHIGLSVTKHTFRVRTVKGHARKKFCGHAPTPTGVIGPT